MRLTQVTLSRNRTAGVGGSSTRTVMHTLQPTKYPTAYNTTVLETNNIVHKQQVNLT